ncbi:MAG: glycosyltransferase [Chloroflexota bacterium]|nr:MAG: glycosyltransferase [Chloroflexota bacterium]
MDPIDPRRPRILHVGPLPPTQTGIADYAAELLPWLAEQMEVTVAIDDGEPLPQIDLPVIRRSELSLDGIRRGHDATLYQIGNHSLHAWIVDLADRCPGIVVLHDGTLHHLAAEALLTGRRRPASYLRLLARAAGLPGARTALATIAGARPEWYGHPLVERAVRRALALVVHSSSVANVALGAGAGVTPEIIHHGVGAPPERALSADERAMVRRAHGLDPTAFVIGTFGGATSEKAPETLARAFASMSATYPSAALVVAGEVAPDVAPIFASLRRCHVLGRLDLPAFEDVMAACDVCVQLRWPTAGEASGATLRALRLGCPTIVSDVGWFSTLPRAAVCHVTTTGDTVPDARHVESALRHLFDDGEARDRLSSAAQDYARTHSWSAAAEAYAALIRRVASTRNDATVASTRG